MDFKGFLFHPSSLTEATLAVILAICLSKVIGSILVEKKGKKRYHPVIGTTLNLMLNFSRLHHYLTHLTTKYRSFRLLAPYGSMVITVDPANVEHILKTNFANYVKGWYHHEILSDLLGDGIFTVDGEKWQHQRKISIYEFSTKKLKEFSSGVFRNNGTKLAQILSKAAASNQLIEIQDLLMKSTLDSIFKIILGVDLDSMCGTNEEGKRFYEAFDEANTRTMYRYVDIVWKIKKLLNIGSEALLRDKIKVVDEFVYKLIQSKIEQVHNSQDDSTVKKQDILSRFLELKETDPKYLKDIILSIIIAGKDTTASTLSWFVYMLCKHPHIQEKIAREVREATKLKDNSTLDELAASITEDALDKMQYLHAALTETLRLYPAVPMEGKLCESDDILPDGFNVRGGNTVHFHPYAMGRMKFLWGDDAEEFRPERWLNEGGIFQQESPFKFSAFNAGPRICLGKAFAYRQMKIFSAVLLGAFVFRLSDEKKEVNYKTALTLHIDGGLHIQTSNRMENGGSMDV
ncbi:cytochrome P450 704C1-like [Malania oleifera]|uniref:cytochrome P450 704C1-like n=1 Tax=Malania oleifera TaxID=397392 RepID=UPI0025ADE5C8|nr:cytochrome P450 704C1-like [Malania oleifera]